MRISWRKTALAIAILGSVATLMAVYLAVGEVLTRPDLRPVDPPPPSLNATPLRIPCRSGAILAAWLAQPAAPNGTVLILHGIHANRTAMRTRAKLLYRAGHAVLVPDLRAHGESTGDRITLGHLEGRDAIDCMEQLRWRHPDLRAGALGCSLGAAALILAGPDLEADALILEAPYSTIERATDNRIAMRVGSISRVLTPLLLLQLRPRMGISGSQLRPLEAVSDLRVPILLAAGSGDQHTTEEETRALFAAAQEPKELWLVPRAKHVDLLRYDREGYEQRVVGFFDRHLVVDER